MKLNKYSIALSFVGLTCLNYCNTAVPRNNRNVIYEPSHDCLEHGINAFNRRTTLNLVKEIQEANSKRYLLNELKSKYPAARERWNASLTEISNNFDDNWPGLSNRQNELDDFDPTEVVAAAAELADEKAKLGDNFDPKNYKPKESQDFFQILDELKNGRPRRHDILSRQATAEKQNYKQRLDNIVKATLRNNCRHVTSTEIRARLQPIFLPENFDDCLTMKID